MDEIRARAVTIRSVGYQEYDRIVTLYAEGKGKITLKLRGVRKPAAKLRFLAMPGAVSEIILIGSKRGYVLTCAEIIDSHLNLTKNLDAYYMTSVMLELLDKFAYEGDVKDDYFNTVTDFLDELGKDLHLSVLNKYIAEFLKLSGYELICALDNPTEAVSFMPGDIGFNNRGIGIKISNEIYNAVVRTNNFAAEREYSPEVFKILLYHIENVADVRLKSAAEYLKLMNLQAI